MAPAPWWAEHDGQIPRLSRRPATSYHGNRAYTAAGPYPLIAFDLAVHGLLDGNVERVMARL